MNDIDVRSIQIALRDIENAKRELEATGAFPEAGHAPVTPVITPLANALKLVVAIECRSLNASISSLQRGYMTVGTNPLAKSLRRRLGPLTKVIRALDALNDEARSAQ